MFHHDWSYTLQEITMLYWGAGGFGMNFKPNMYLKQTLQKQQMVH